MGARQSLPFGTDDSRRRWHARLVRAKELSERHKPIAPALRFYCSVLEFQGAISSRITPVFNPNTPLREQIDVDAVAAQLPSLLSLATQHGPELLSQAAQQWASAGEQRWHQALRSALEADEPSCAGADDFFTRTCLQPVAENLQLQIPEAAYTGSSKCPACGAPPQMAVLRPEGDAAGRGLLCSFCLRDWPFRRLICPWCQEEDKEKLPRFSSDDWPFVHVEACDTCRRYLKAIDMTVDGLAVPLVDEAAFSVLDVWAADRGYTKIVPNVLGL